MFRILLLLSIIACAWAFWLMARSDPSERMFGTGLVLAVPIAWALWMGQEWRER